MIVRRAVVGDAPGIAAARLSNGPAHDDSGASAEYCRHLIEHEHLWVAVDGQRVVGFGGAVQVGEARLLSDLFVHADEHGRGVGGALLARVMHGAAETFTFATHDPAAAALYTRMGMVRRCEVITLDVPVGALDSAPGGAVGGATELVAVPIDADAAATLEADATGVNRSGCYRYWAGRDRSRTLAVSDPSGVRAVCAVRTGDSWARIEHLALVGAHRDRDASNPGVERAILGAVATLMRAAVLQISLRSDRPLAALLSNNSVVTDTAIYMASRSDLLSDHVVVLHSGFG